MTGNPPAILPIGALCASLRVPDVLYRTIPELPAETFFDCHRLHAGLSTTSCAAMWRQANEGQSERHSACRACFVGATHAGVPNASKSPIRGARVCARCAAGSTRLIFGHLCVSCYNREREMIRGRNARGMVPTKLKPLYARSIFYRANGRAQLVRRERTVSPGEMMLAALRDSLHTVMFGWHGGRQGLRQLRLF